MKVSRAEAAKMRARANAKVVRREARVRRSKGTKPRSRTLPLSFFAVVLGGVCVLVQPEGSVPLPDTLDPEAFASCIQLSDTARVGTLIQVTVIQPPEPDSSDDFKTRVKAAAGIARGAGYESIRVKDALGLTWVAGPLDDLRFLEPDPDSDP